MIDPLKAQRLLADPHRWTRDPAFCSLALRDWQRYLRTPVRLNEHVSLMLDALQPDGTARGLHRGHWLTSAAAELAHGTIPAMDVLDEENRSRLLVWAASR